jgi:hypothetical protein
MMAPDTHPCLRRDIDQRRPRPSPRRTRSAADSLQSAWLAWRLRHPASRDLTRAATELHVAEAHLLAAIEGDGATALRPDLPDLLATVASWGRLELDIPHGLGRVQLRMKPMQVRFDHRMITLIEGAQRVHLSTQGVASCYLVNVAEPDQHSLQWFDRDGHVIARLRLLATDQYQALPHLLQFSNADAPRSLPPHKLERPPELQLPADWCALDTMIRPGPGLIRLAQALPQALAHVPGMRLMLPGCGVALACTGSVTTTPDSSANCSLQIETAKLAHAYVCVAPDGTPFLRLHAHEGGLISLQPLLDPTTAWAWIDTLVPSRRA